MTHATKAYLYLYDVIVISFYEIQLGFPNIIHSDLLRDETVHSLREVSKHIITAASTIMRDRKQDSRQCKSGS